jgi:hypothetical protein
MKKFLSLVIPFFFIAACSSTPGERQNAPPPTIQGGSYIPGAGINAQTGIGTASVFTSDPVGVAALAGVSIATNPDYYRQNTISGRCVIANTKVESLQTPCNNITVILTNSKGEGLTKASTTKGEFAFKVNKGESYGLVVQHPKYQLEKPMGNSLALGDSVILKLLPR